MTLITPPSWLQNGTYPAQSDRLTQQAIYSTTGIIGTSSLEVIQNTPAGMSVKVNPGWGAVIGTTTSNMGAYVAYNDAVTTLTITTADPTNPRIDKVVMTVRDSYYSGTFDDVIFQVIAGTAAASPSAPATPDNSLSLATVYVGAAVTQINTANITDTRVAVTSNLTSGDITEVSGSTGITVTSGTGPIPVIAIDTTVTADLTTAQTLTNKTLTTPVITQGVSTPTFSANAYTLALSDAGKMLLASNSSTAGTVYIPTNASAAFPIGTQISLIQTGSGQLTVAAATPATTTIYSTGTTSTAPKARTIYSGLVATKTATDTWYINGDLS